MVSLGMSSKFILHMEIKATKVMDKHHKAILAMGKQLILYMNRTMVAILVMEKTNQVIHNLMVALRIKNRAHMANSLTITRDNKTWNHQRPSSGERAPSYDQSDYGQQDSYN